MFSFFNRHPRHSLKQDFSRIFIFIVTCICLLLIWLTWKVYEHQSDLVLKRLDQQSNRIIKGFNELFEFTIHQIQYIEQNIKENGASPHEIKKLFKTLETQPNVNLYWSTFLWSDKHFNVLATNDLGILTDIKSLANRDYIPLTKSFPGILHAGQPVYGITSKKWIIPAGYGIVDQHDIYQGTVVTGFIISKLITLLDKSVTLEGIEFAVIDQNDNIILTSEAFHESPTYKGIMDALPSTKLRTTRDYIAVKNDLLPGSFPYGLYEPIPNTPFRLVTTYDKSINNQEIWNILYPRIVEVAALGLILLLVLAILKNKIIIPLSQISHVAEQISQGKYISKLPRSEIYEIFILSTQLLKVQRQIQKIQRIDKKLLNAKDKADEANRAKSEFLSSMGHELRTPLNAIIGYSEIIKEQMLGPIGTKKYLEYSADIYKSGYDLLRLINDILDIADAESGQLKLQEEVTDLGKSVTNAIKMIQGQASKKLITIHTAIDECLPLIWADELRIRQIFFYLMSNSVKFSEVGTTIHINISCHHDGIHLTVKDYGYGMDPEQIQKAMEKFSQLDSSISRKEEGAGVGLWLVKFFTDAHQGKLHITSTPNVGTLVTIILPKSRIIEGSRVEGNVLFSA